MEPQRCLHGYNDPPYEYTGLNSVLSHSVVVEEIYVLLCGLYLYIYISIKGTQKVLTCIAINVFHLGVGIYKTGVLNNVPPPLDE